jgi:hypothetical protein
VRTYPTTPHLNDPEVLGGHARVTVAGTAHADKPPIWRTERWVFAIDASNSWQRPTRVDLAGQAGQAPQVSRDTSRHFTPVESLIDRVEVRVQATGRVTPPRPDTMERS